MNHECKICSSSATFIFRHKVLWKYDVNYYKCTTCRYVFTEKPFWLKEAYRNPINRCDTGILARNIIFSQITSTIIYLFFDRKAKFLDYSGGYGVFTRLMRDMGWDYYWDDPMAKNIFAQNFEYKHKTKIELLTAFECFEHFENPLEEVEKMLKISKNILFSTELINEQNPSNEWWYFGFDHGQHISFYSEKTFVLLAKKYNLNYYNLNGLGLFTERKLNKYLLTLSRNYSGVVSHLIKGGLHPLTVKDMEKVNEIH